MDETPSTAYQRDADLRLSAPGIPPGLTKEAASDAVDKALSNIKRSMEEVTRLKAASGTTTPLYQDTGTGSLERQPATVQSKKLDGDVHHLNADRPSSEEQLSRAPAIGELRTRQKCMEMCMALENTSTQPGSLISKFSEHDVTDFWLPIPKQTLRVILRDNKSEKAFYDKQESYFSTSWGNLLLDSDEVRPHYAFEDGEEMLRSDRILGEGGYGIIEEVTLSTTPRPIVCVRKRFGRPRQLKAQKQIFDAFIREIKVMRQVKHYHCVDFVGSYTDFDSLAILSTPVADMDLATLLDLPDLSDSQVDLLFSSIGCLCTALDYLHKNKIIHKDIKPQNVLVHGDNILLTDFGFSLDFSECSVSTTTGRPIAWTARYSAPEVLHFEPRNRATDIWSLGCVFVEIISALCDYRLSTTQKHWRQAGNSQPSFALNQVATTEWLSHLKQDFPSRLLFIKEVETMLDPARSQRPSARQILDDMIKDYFPFMPPMIGRCCWPKIPHILPVQNAFDSHEHIWAEPFFPGQYDDWKYILTDLESVYMTSNDGKYGPDSLPFHTSSYQLIQSAQQALLRFASRNGTTKAYWETQAGGSLLTQKNGIEHSLRSLRLVSLNQIVFTAMTSAIKLAPSQESPWISRKVFISLLPICVPNSECHGLFFFMLSFNTRTDIIHDFHCQLDTKSSRWGLTDLTLGSAEARD